MKLGYKVYRSFIVFFKTSNLTTFQNRSTGERGKQSGNGNNES